MKRTNLAIGASRTVRSVLVAPLILTLLLSLGGCGDDDGGTNSNNVNDNENSNDPICGNGQMEVGEVCDDGAANSDSVPDACRTDCRSAWCGDAVADSSEACDDGNTSDEDGCLTTCVVNVCGDGHIDRTLNALGEQTELCDDGDDNGQTCLEDCQRDMTLCGNGVQDPGEECDDGSQNSDLVPDACRSDCVQAACGDAVPDTGEACDDGAQNSDLVPNACRTDCAEAHCGDDVLDDGEGCDEGADNSEASDATCRTDCEQAGCGDGVLDTGEQCDNGTSNSDTLPNSCRTNCLWAGCGDGVTDSGETCDDGTFNSDTDPDACRTSCLLASCGDGVNDSADDCDDGNATEWDGCTSTCTVGEFQVNTFTTGWQSSPAVTWTASCGFAVIWNSDGQDGDGYGVFGQRYTDAGAQDGAELSVNATTANAQTAGGIASAADGRSVVVWQSDQQDGDSYGVFGQRYTSAGATDGAEFQINTYTAGLQGGAEVAMAADGRFVVVWTSVDQDGDGNGVYGQRYTSAGVADGAEFRVNTYTAGHQDRNALAMAADGRFVVVWTSFDQDGDSYGVYGQRYTSAGVPDGGEFQVNTFVAGIQNSASVSMAADGRFVVVWNSGGQDGDLDGVFGQRYTSAGVPAGVEFQVNVLTAKRQNSPQVIVGDDGHFVVVWSSRDQDGDLTGIFSQLFDNLGIPLGVGAYTCP